MFTMIHNRIRFPGRSRRSTTKKAAKNAISKKNVFVDYGTYNPASDQT
jgi:hypothetical protein